MSCSPADEPRSGAMTLAEQTRLVHEYLAKHRGARQTNKVLYGHPSPLLWRDFDVPVGEVLARQEASAAVHKSVNVYIGTPYCVPTKPPRCGFCYLPCEPLSSRSQLAEYLHYLRLEGEMYRPYLRSYELRNIYIGGGTANLYSSEQYRELLEMARSVLGVVGPNVQVTLEGVPQLFSKDKLAAMKDAGINRISIGAQQLEPEMIRMSGRKQTKEQVLRAVDWCHQLSLQCSVDLIYGWPLQTVDRMLGDLEAITATGVAHITHYELNVAGRTDFALNRADQLPSTEENLQLYRAAKEFLEGRGYIQITAHDWKKPRTKESGAHSFEESWHAPLSLQGDTLHRLDLWGWGYGGVSFFLGTPELPGWTYRNFTSVDNYFEALDAGRYPIERGFRFTAKDQRLNVVFQALQGMRIDRHGYQSVFGLDLVDELAAVWQALAELGWAEIDDESVALVGDGVFYTPLIQTTLARATAGNLIPLAADGE